MDVMNMDKNPYFVEKLI